MKYLSILLLTIILIGCGYKKVVKNDPTTRDIWGKQYTGFWWRIEKNSDNLWRSDYVIMPVNQNKDSTILEAVKYMDALIREDKRIDSINQTIN